MSHNFETNVQQSFELLLTYLQQTLILLLLQ